MAVFGPMQLTTQGQALYSKAQTGTTLTFTRMQLGGGQLTSGQDPTKLTALITPISYFNINSESANGNTATIKGIFENTNLTSATYVCEIGLFAQDPTAGEILYSYANAGTQGDTLPSYANGPLSRQFNINVAVGNATSVTANIPANTYIPTTQLGVASGVATLDATGKVLATQLNISAPANATSSQAGLVEVVETPASGVPVALTRCASFQETLINGTSAKTVLTYTPQANHNFELNLYFRVKTATTTVTITVTYTDAGGAETYFVLNAQSCAVGQYSCVPFSFNATTSGPIAVSITAGTANQIYASGALKAI